MLLILVTTATVASARDLPVPPGKGWQHAATGLILTATLDGMPRTKLIDQTTTEHDVAAEFADQATVAAIYVFHPAVDNITMWFERSEIALTRRATFGDVAPASADPVAFVPPGAKVASGLRRVYAPGRGNYRGTGLAIMPLGEWLVAVRISSTALPPAALDTRLSAVIAALRWPAGVADAPAAAPIPACAKPLTFSGKAKRMKPKGGDVLLSLLGPLVAAQAKAKGEPGEVVRWCRDPASRAAFGVYRDIAHDIGYTIALQDAGRVVQVVPSLDAQMGKGDAFTVSLVDVDDMVVNFPNYDRLPAPDQVFDALSGPRMGTGTKGQVTIDPGALSG